VLTQHVTLPTQHVTRTAHRTILASKRLATMNSPVTLLSPLTPSKKGANADVQGILTT